MRTLTAHGTAGPSRWFIRLLGLGADVTTGVFSAVGIAAMFRVLFREVPDAFRA